MRAVSRPHTTTLGLCVLCAFASVPRIAAQEAAGDDPPAAAVPDVARWVSAGSGGAVLRNLADLQGLDLLRAPAGTPLAVHRTNGDWLLVEPPGGMPVWAFGRFFAETPEDDVLVVTANAVNMRPRPSSEVSSFPLLSRLHGQDRVHLIRRQDESLELEEDWLQLWSPPGAAAWVHTGEVADLADRALAAERWHGVLAQGGLPLPATPGGEPGVSGEPSDTDDVDVTSTEEARAALLEAETRYAQRRPDAVTVAECALLEAAFQRVLELEAEGPAAMVATRRLELVAALRKAAELRATLEEERLRRERELIARQEEIWEQARRRDPLSHRFDARGVLARHSAPNRLDRWFLTWRDATGTVVDVCEVVCRTGRFDLDLFAGCELGVMATTLQSVRVETGAEDASPRVLDVARIEVISSR